MSTGSFTNGDLCYSQISPDFPLTQCDGHQHVWRHHGEQYMPNVVLWGGTIIDGHMDLVVIRGNLTAAGYIEQTLLQHVLVAAYGVGPEFILMHNNARAHIVRITRAVLRELDIQEME